MEALTPTGDTKKLEVEQEDKENERQESTPAPDKKEVVVVDVEEESKLLENEDAVDSADVEKIVVDVEEESKLLEEEDAVDSADVEKIVIDEGKVEEVKECGALKRKSDEGIESSDAAATASAAVAGNEEAKKPRIGEGSEVEEVVGVSNIAQAKESATPAAGIVQDAEKDKKDAAIEDRARVAMQLKTMDKDDIVVIDVDDESNDATGIDTKEPDTDKGVGEEDKHDDKAEKGEDEEKQMDVEVPEVEMGDAVTGAEELKDNVQEEREEVGGWGQEKVLLVREIEFLRGKVDRLVERQMLLEDFALVEYSARFRTFFHAREKILDLGRKRRMTDPSCVLAPGSSYLIEILRVINEKADGEIEEINVTEQDILKIEADLKKLKSRLSSASPSINRSQDKPQTQGTHKTNVSADASFPPTLPHKFTSDNQPVYDSCTPAGVLPNPLYAGKGQVGNRSNLVPIRTTTNGGGTGKKRSRQKPKVTCEVCQLSMNVALYKKLHLHQHVGIIYACPVCKEKKGSSHRDVNRCLRENHGTVPGEMAALLFIQEEDGSERPITCKEQLEEEQNLFLTKFKSLPSEEREKIKQKFLADQERTREDNKIKNGESKHSEDGTDESGLQIEENSATTSGTGGSEDVEILEVVANKTVEKEKGDSAPSSTTILSNEKRKWEIIRSEAEKKIEQQGIGLSSSSAGTKVGKPFPVPTVAVSSTTSGTDSRSPDAAVPGGPTPSKRKRNRGRKRAGLSPVLPSPQQKQQSQRYFQTPTPKSKNTGSGLSMASRSILGRGGPKPRSNSFINATHSFEDSTGPTRSSISSFGESRVSPYGNANRGAGRGRVDSGISSYVGAGRGLGASHYPVSNNSERLVTTNARHIPASEERFRVDASCLGENLRGSSSGGGGMRRFDYSSGGGNQNDFFEDDRNSPSLLSSNRRPVFDNNFGFPGNSFELFDNNNAMGNERSNALLPSVRNTGGYGPASLSFEDRYARAETAHPTFGNSRMSTGYTMSSRPAQYGYFTSPSSANNGGVGGMGSKPQGQFNSYAEYAQSVLNQNRYR